MRTSRRHDDLLAGIAAGAGLLVLVAGVPVALATAVGWPLPRTVPSPEAVVTALRYGQIAPTTLLQSLAVIVWLTWAAITAGIALEVAAVVRGTVARALPGLAPVQRVAARLVATVMLISSVTTRAAAEPPATTTSGWPPVSTQVDRDVDLGGPQPAPQTRRTDAGRWWTVRRHDSLWAIAERTLGDGHRWREIAKRNIDRPQPDGGRLRRGDTIIRPGWRLELPPDAVAPSTPARVEVAQGDDLWGIATRHLDDGERWREIFAHNRGRRQPDGCRLEDPDLIRPGWILHLPADTRVTDDDATRAHETGARRRTTRRPPTEDAPDDGDADARRSEVEDPTAGGDSGATRGRGPQHRGRTTPLEQVPDSGDGHTPPVPNPVTPSTLPPSPASHATRDPNRDAATPPPSDPGPTRAVSTTSGRSDHGALTPAATAVLAAGLVSLLAAGRRHWLSRRTDGASPAPVDPEAAELERWLRSMADHDLTHRTDRVLRVLTGHFAAHGVAPAVRAVELGDDVALHLAQAVGDGPPSITVTHGGRRWVVGAELEVAPADGARRYVPALVSCGRVATGALLLLDPTAADAVGVSGPDDLVADAMTSWTTELAATGAARGVEIIVVGRHHALIERLARVSLASGGAAALDRVQRVLDTDESPSARVVVLCGAGVPPGDADALADAARHPRVGVVVAGRDDLATSVTLGHDGVHLQPDDLRLDPPEWLTPDDWDRFGDLLRRTDRARVVPPAPPALRPVVAADAVELEAATDPSDAVSTVGVLGPLTIDGRRLAVDDDTAELLTWLAVHRTGAASGALDALLRPGRAPEPSAIERAITGLDALVGASGPVVVHTDDGRVELRDTVTTDLARVDALLRGLDRHPPPVQARRAYESLELVRGEPFTECGAWAHADGTALRTTGMIIDVAHRLAMQALTIGDVERATWAVGRGLLAAPTNELLHRDRMRIADMTGDTAGIETCMRRLRLRVETEGGWLTPETEALYRELRGATEPDSEADVS